MSEPQDHAKLAEMTTEIVSAFVSHNQVRPVDMAHLIELVGSRLATLEQEAAQPAAAKPEPIVPVRRSVSKDRLICLVCGKKQKLLKKHLASAHDLTPDQYRELYDLKKDYPMVAPSYAATRSEMARKIGLGRPKERRASKRTTTAKQTKATKPAKASK